MFTAIYVWRVKEGREKDFVNAWKELTILLRERNESLGSRLHKGEQGVYFAYAQWPSKDLWANPKKDMTSRMNELRKILRDCSTKLQKDIIGTVCSDYLIF